MTETCSKCAAPMKMGAAFCTKCGSRRPAPATTPPASAPRPQAAEGGTPQTGYVPQARRNKLKPLHLTLGATAVMTFIFFAWLLSGGFFLGVEQGLRGIPPSGSAGQQMPVTTPNEPSEPGVTTTPLPVVSDPNQPADETYTLPRTDKNSPTIDQEYVDNMQRAAEALNSHTDLTEPLTKRQDWSRSASILWDGVLTLQDKAQSAPFNQRSIYKKRAQDLAHLCHLVQTEPDNPKLQHYKVKIIYATDDQMK